MSSAAPYPDLTGHEPCATSDPELFFAEKGGSTRPAKDLCATCDVRRACLAYALTHKVAGVWGGLSERDIQNLRKTHGIKAVPFYGRQADLDDTDDDTEQSA